jgi:acetyl esterase/lipase
MVVRTDCDVDAATPLICCDAGAYYVFSAATHRLITIPLSKFVGARVFAIDYRLAPETRFPGPLHDAVSAYFRLLDDLHIPSENILIAGDSAGGGLSLGLLMYLRDNGYPMPAGAILMSPWVGEYPDSNHHNERRELTS